jgi:hypothetical protein
MVWYTQHCYDPHFCNEITTSCEASTIHADLPMSGNHDSDRRSMAPSVPTHNENHNYHDPSNTCIHNMDHAHANTFTPMFQTGLEVRTS